VAARGSTWRGDDVPARKTGTVQRSPGSTTVPSRSAASATGHGGAPPVPSLRQATPTVRPVGRRRSCCTSSNPAVSDAVLLRVSVCCVPGISCWTDALLTDASSPSSPSAVAVTTTARKVGSNTSATSPAARRQRSTAARSSAAPTADTVIEGLNVAARTATPAPGSCVQAYASGVVTDSWKNCVATPGPPAGVSTSGPRSASGTTTTPSPTSPASAIPPSAVRRRPRRRATAATGSRSSRSGASAAARSSSSTTSSSLIGLVIGLLRVRATPRAATPARATCGS
jgi:hypothetical protein